MKLLIYCLLLLPVACQTAHSQTAPPLPEAAKIIQPSQATTGTTTTTAATTDTAPLRNADVLEMLKARLSPEVVVAKIRASAADFDTSPAALKELRAAGAPDAVVIALVEAPRASAEPPARPKKLIAVKLPAGTIVEVEAAYRISSQEVRKGDLLTFRVVNPVKVEGVTVIEPGAVATARVEKASRGGHWGRAGRLAWQMYEVTAADGTRVAIEADGRQVGDSKGAKVAAQTVAVGALLGPFAPISLFHGFKRGENAYLPQGKRFNVFVRADATVNASVEQE